MKDLDLLGMHPDGTQLILNDADGERYALALTEELRNLIGMQAPLMKALPPVLDSAPRPAQIQAMIRSGMSSDQIAKRYQIPVENIRKYERPILAERKHAARKAQQCRVGAEPDSPILGDLAIDRLAARGVDPESLRWDAVRQGKNPWQIRLTFIQGATEIMAHWQMEPNSSSIVALDDEAIWLTETRRPGGLTKSYDDDFDEAVAIAVGTEADTAEENFTNLPNTISDDNVRTFHSVQDSETNTIPIVTSSELLDDAEFLNQQLSESDNTASSFSKSDAERTEALLDYLNQARGQRNCELPSEFLDDDEELDYSRLADLADRYGLDELSDLSSAELAELLAEEALAQATANDNVDTQQFDSLENNLKAKVTPLPTSPSDSDNKDILNGQDSKSSSLSLNNDPSSLSEHETEKNQDSESLTSPISEELKNSEVNNSKDEDASEVNLDLKVKEQSDAKNDQSKENEVKASKTAKVLSFTKRALGVNREQSEEAILDAVLEDIIANPATTDSLSDSEDRSQTNLTDSDESKPLTSPSESCTSPSEPGDSNISEITVSEAGTGIDNSPLPGLSDLEKESSPQKSLVEENPEANCETVAAPIISDDQLLLPPPSRNKKKNSKRQSVPSWDDIVFGTKSHD